MGFRVWGPGTHGSAWAPGSGVSLVQPGVEVRGVEMDPHRDGTWRRHLPSICWTAAAGKGGTGGVDPRSREATVAD